MLAIFAIRKDGFHDRPPRPTADLEPGHDGPFAMAHCGGGYMTNLPVEDLTDGRAWVAYA
jgi:hypothetical protein